MTYEPTSVNTLDDYQLQAMATRNDGTDLIYVAEANLAKLRQRHGASYNPAHYTEAG